MDIKKIDLGKDEAEQDIRLQEYFLKTQSYNNALTGKKNIIIGRKGSGKSAIFKILAEELLAENLVISITPDQYSWSALKDYQEQGIMQEQAHTNAWKFTLLSSILWSLNEKGLLDEKTKLKKYFQYLNDAFKIDKTNWFFSLVDKIRNSGIKTQWFSMEDAQRASTPLRIITEIVNVIKEEINDIRVRILIDKLDDSWDGTEQSKNIIIGLLKAAFDLNSQLDQKVIITSFLRSDIYDTLFFHDQDKLRQYEETIFWNSFELKKVITERVRVSLSLSYEDSDKIWSELFSDKKYRSKASAEKYIIDRTFKRPRDIISYVRMSLEYAIESNHDRIEVLDTRTAEEEKYSKSKYNDLIIEYQKQFVYIKDLLDSFTGSLHKIDKDDIIKKLTRFIEKYSLQKQPTQLLRDMFSFGVIGVKRRGKTGVQTRGGTKFYYYFDDSSINPLSFNEYFFHPSLRYHLNITEKREKQN